MNERETSPSVGTRIRTLRENLHWSQARLCKEAKVQRSWLSLVELSLTKSPRAVDLERVARALGTSTHYLLTGEDTSNITLDTPIEPGSEDDLNWFASLPADRRRALRAVSEVFQSRRD